jgi:hypothetical protein
MSYSWRDGLRWLNPRRFVSADLRGDAVFSLGPRMPDLGTVAPDQAMCRKGYCGLAVGLPRT